VSVVRFNDPQPSRTVGMIWRKSSPLAGQLLQLSEVVCRSAEVLREEQDSGPPSRRTKRRSSAGYSIKGFAAPHKRSA
jgi:LysR family transcriptional regulator, hydrogen peroxide-inducible genes activator